MTGWLHSPANCPPPPHPPPHPHPPALQGIISQWAQLPRETQQAVYNEALVATEEGSLGDLEEGLQMVLATAPLPEAPPAGPE